MLKQGSTGEALDDEHFYISYSDGKLIGPIQEAIDNKETAKHALNNRLTPVKLFDTGEEGWRARDTVEIRLNTELIDEERGDTLKAIGFDIVESDDLECGFERRITFRVNPWEVPARTVMYYETDLRDLFIDGTLVLKSKRAEELYEQLKTEAGVE